MMYFTWIIAQLRAARQSDGDYSLGETTIYFFFRSGQLMAEWDRATMDRFVHAIHWYHNEF